MKANYIGVNFLYGSESLQKLVTEVEESLLDLADTVERKELQEKQLESRFQLVIHSEKRQGQLDTLRGMLFKANY